MAASSITRFFVDAFASALELGIATPDDVLKHATPDVLAHHLPRPLWAKLIAACLAAPRADAKLVVDTIGVPDLCAHVPPTILWACLAEVGARALGRSLLAMPPAPQPGVDNTSNGRLAVGTSPGTQPAPAAPSPIAAAPAMAPAPEPIARTGSQPISTHIPVRAQTEPPAPLGELPPVGSRAPTAKPIPSSPSGPSGPPGPPSRTTGAMPAVSTTAPASGNGLRTSGAGASSRRPQANAVPTATVPEAKDAKDAKDAAPRERKGPRTAPPSGRRGTTATDFDIDTDVSEWKQAAPAAAKPIAEVVDDDLVDWAQAEETATGGVDLERKR